ncbi:STAS domain-containing protein [Sporosarcina sp. BI001-red]|uniref:STAS domain-containing protein n=1 Tax=Sporosarcina sp. BI001-red TaxID=2282866 RepID=UPI000E25A777|nr:STAS domain-containing protein [Sporosarcina sp. BI001-red]REB04783.1 STAS domain-containing protein [Sporosarcina sp. BI001-red]
MKELLTRLSDKVIGNAEQLAMLITTQQNERYPIMKRLEYELYPARVELVKLYANALKLEETERIEHLRKWGQEAGTHFAKKESISLDMMLREVPEYRSYIGTVLKHEGIKSAISSEDMYELTTALDTIVNDVVYYFSLPFVYHEKEMLKISQAAIAELSVPIASINDTTAILPLIGIMDFNRGSVLQEKVLKEAVRLNLEHLIIDLSGLLTTDTFVAQQLFILFESLSLVGTVPVVSGVTPAIAQTLVGLGLDFGSIKSFAMLKQAIEYVA